MLKITRNKIEAKNDGTSRITVDTDKLFVIVVKGDKTFFFGKKESVSSEVAFEIRAKMEEIARNSL